MRKVALNEVGEVKRKSILEKAGTKAVKIMT